MVYSVGQLPTASPFAAVPAIAPVAAVASAATAAAAAAFNWPNPFGNIMFCRTGSL